MKERTIFKTYEYYTLEEIKEQEQAEKEFLSENYPDQEFTDYDITNQILESIDLWWSDERLNLDKELENDIVCLGTIGRWHGRIQGYKVCSNNLKDILRTYSNGCQAGLHVYYDGYNVRAEECHHDGTNTYLYRELRPDRNTEDFLDKVYSGAEISNRELNYYTKSLRKPIKEVYGF